MKKTWKCPKCDSQRVGYLEEVLDEQDPTRRDHARKVGMASAGSFLGLQAFSAHGRMEAFVCTDCGYFEEYVKDPHSVRWNDLQGFRWCRPELAAPR
jgi:predicted nucleic-acid-binding Zn-ribbon protein